MPDPKVWIDVEVGFASGQTQTISMLEGRDTADQTDTVYTITTHPDEQTTDTLIVHAAQWEYQRVVRRVVPTE